MHPSVANLTNDLVPTQLKNITALCNTTPLRTDPTDKNAA
uniref:Uncharacterized protein n=1 Tax=Arundo donax TaxID=35708 RepID=A0A0A9DJM4_ARUDO